MQGLFDIRGKTALVTGGVNGLGRMMVEGLLRAGVKVYATTRKAESIPAAMQELNALGNCVVLAADLAAPEGAAALAAEIKAREPKLHILINNAGRTWGAPLESFPDKGWSSVMMVNVQTPFNLVRDLLPLLQAAGTPADPARVINIGSIVGNIVERLGAFSYSASKAAIHHLSRVLAVELADKHITVNAILPGYFPTHMTAYLRDKPAENQRLVSRIPLARLGEPDDIVGMCVFLCSRAGRYVTGAELTLDGGMTLSN